MDAIALRIRTRNRRSSNVRLRIRLYHQIQQKKGVTLVAKSESRYRFQSMLMVICTLRVEGALRYEICMVLWDRGGGCGHTAGGQIRTLIVRYPRYMSPVRLCELTILIHILFADTPR